MRKGMTGVEGNEENRKAKRKEKKRCSYPEQPCSYVSPCEEVTASTVALKKVWRGKKG